MVFSSLSLLCFFLPATIAGYALLWKAFGKRSTAIPNLFLCAASLLFYNWEAEPGQIQILLLLIAFNYFVSYILRTKNSKTALGVGIVFDCFILLRYKYPKLLLETLGAVMTGEAKLIETILPLGMSFIIFHCISYLVDTYRLENKASDAPKELEQFINFSLYILFFPKLIQGPIVRYNDICGELRNREFGLDGICSGCERFILGLAKKVLLADALGESLALMTASSMDTPTAWLAVLVYSLQLYLDFSGYSDMAIGLAKIFGFSFCENFRFPYLSSSITEFWRRWHISLGSWFREYVYIPLGGSRTGNVYINLFIVFLLTGMWHGNTNIYLCWGIAHGLIILLERTQVYQKIRRHIPLANFWGWLYTISAVSLGWLCFRLKFVSDFFDYMKLLLGAGNQNLTFTWRYYLTPKLMFLILVSCIGMVLLSRRKTQEKIRSWNGESVVFHGVKYIVLIGLFLVSFMAIVTNGYSPFLYFQF